MDQSITILPPSLVRLLARPIQLLLTNTRKWAHLDPIPPRVPNARSVAGITQESSAKKTLKTDKTQLIARVLHGSRLYGTHSANSDWDYKGIFMPAREDILLGRIPAVQNVDGECDEQWFSLHRFVELACQGQTVAIEMLYAPEECVEVNPEYADIWTSLVKNRQRFLTKEMKVFVGYARAQTNKYSLKGARLHKLRSVTNILDTFDDESEFAVAANVLRANGLVEMERKNPQGLLEMQIGSKWYGETTAVRVVKENIGRQIARYGHRARDAEGGPDWKALSHAYRVARQLQDLLRNGEIVFPLPYAQELLDIKHGVLRMEAIQDILERQLAFLEVEMSQSSLPNKVDGVFWDQWLLANIKL